MHILLIKIAELCNINFLNLIIIRKAEVNDLWISGRNAC